MISYAQNQEDVLLDRVFPRGVPGTYIDIGAFDPVVDSVTKHFYELGWHGINVEPAAGPFERLRASRDRDVNLNVGLSSEPGTMTLYESAPESGLSTFDAALAAGHREQGFDLVERAVPVRTLRDVCAELVDGPIDFVSVDVEGHERDVLEGGDWDRWRPRVILVEATRPRTSIPSHDEWEPVLLKANYVFVTFDGLNRYYVRGEDAQLAVGLRTPANVLDNYVPYRHHKQVEDLRNALDSTRRIVAAARAANESLRAESAGHEAELEFLRTELRRFDVVLDQTLGRYESAMVSLRDTRVVQDRLEAEITAVRSGLTELLADVGPSAIAVARSLGRIGRRVPAGGTAMRAARSVKRMLRGAAR